MNINFHLNSIKNIGSNALQTCVYLFYYCLKQMVVTLSVPQVVFQLDSRNAGERIVHKCIIPLWLLYERPPRDGCLTV